MFVDVTIHLVHLNIARHVAATIFYAVREKKFGSGFHEEIATIRVLHV